LLPEKQSSHRPGRAKQDNSALRVQLEESWHPPDISDAVTDGISASDLNKMT